MSLAPKMPKEKIKKRDLIEYAETMACAVNNLDKHLEILIGKDGSGALYSLKQIKQEFELMVNNDERREFEKKNKMFINQDWEYYWRY